MILLKELCCILGKNPKLYSKYLLENLDNHFMILYFQFKMELGMQSFHILVPILAGGKKIKNFGYNLHLVNF